jgi:hypothetical protein
VTLRIMAFETGLEQEQLMKIIPKLAPQVIWWPEHSIFWVRNFLRRQSANTNPVNFRKSASRALVTRPDDVGAVVREQYPELPMDGDASDTPPTVKDASPMHTDASPMHAETVSVSVSVSEQKQEKDTPPVAIATSPKGGKRATTRIPDDFEVTPKMREDAIGYGVAAEQIRFETEKWRDHHAAKGDVVKDAAASWRVWMRNSVRFAANGRASPNGHAPSLPRATLIDRSDVYLRNGKELSDAEKQRIEDIGNRARARREAEAANGA